MAPAMKLWQLRDLLCASGCLALLIRGLLPARAGLSDLRITEVNPATGQVGVTHIGTNPFTTTSGLPLSLIHI